MSSMQFVITGAKGRCDIPIVAPDFGWQEYDDGMYRIAIYDKEFSLDMYDKVIEFLTEDIDYAIRNKRREPYVITNTFCIDNVKQLELSILLKQKDRKFIPIVSMIIGGLITSLSVVEEDCYNFNFEYIRLYGKQMEPGLRIFGSKEASCEINEPTSVTGRYSNIRFCISYDSPSIKERDEYRHFLDCRVWNVRTSRIEPRQNLLLYHGYGYHTDNQIYVCRESKNETKVVQLITSSPYDICCFDPLSCLTLSDILNNPKLLGSSEFVEEARR